MAPFNVGALVDLWLVHFIKRKDSYSRNIFNYNYSIVTSLPLLIKSINPSKTYYSPMLFVGVSITINMINQF